MKSKGSKSLLCNRKGEQKRDYAQQTKFNAFFDFFIKNKKKEKGSFDQILHTVSFITRISMSGRI